jgi:formylglycine-generating enzyme required for sulfatase activity
MGSPETEKDRNKLSEKQHPVTISSAFYMGEFTVTQAQYEAVMGKNPSSHDGGTNPAENVSWFDAEKFCQKLNETLKVRWGIEIQFQLPTEAQWEYACRAGTKTRFYSGDADSDLDNVAWYCSNIKSKTQPGGQKIPNAWGLYDMHGNVWQWCHDWYSDDYEKLPETDPCNNAQGNFRVMRGGSWGDGPSFHRASSRDSGGPEYRDYFIGFRVVLACSSRTP